MLRQQTAIFLLAGALLSTSALAQNTPCVERMLIPIEADKVPGAFGSLWQTFLTFTNYGETTVPIAGIGSCLAGVCPQSFLEPQTTLTLPSTLVEDYVSIGCADASNIEVNLRVRDLSRALETWGTTIPVVYDQDVFRGEVLSINDIPNTASFRSMLRIYGVRRGTRASVNIRIYEVFDNPKASGARPDALLTEFTAALSPRELEPVTTPGYAQVLLWTLPELQGVDVVRVELVSDESVDLWAMVSATNNLTQHVTILSPRKVRARAD